MPTSLDPFTAAAVAGLGPPDEALAIFLVPDDQPQMTHFLIQRTALRRDWSWWRLLAKYVALPRRHLMPEGANLRVVKVFSLYPVFLNLCLKDQ